MWNCHDILRGIPIAQSRATPHLNERRKARPHHTRFRLEKRPRVDHRIQSPVRRPTLECTKLLVPVLPKILECVIDIRRHTVLPTDFPSFRPVSYSEHENDALLITSLQKQSLVEGSAVVASELGRIAAGPGLDGNRICFSSVGSDKSVPNAVMGIRLEARSEKMVGPRLIEEIVLNDAICVIRTAGVERHLKILIVDFYVMV